MNTLHEDGMNTNHQRWLSEWLEEVLALPCWDWQQTRILMQVRNQVFPDFWCAACKRWDVHCLCTTPDWRQEEIRMVRRLTIPLWKESLRRSEEDAIVAKEKEIVINMQDLKVKVPSISANQLNHKYGIYDTKDNCWIGDEKGPILHDDYALARIAAQITEDQLFSTGRGRVVAREYIPQELKLRDEQTVARSGEESLRRLEEGLI